MPVEIVPGLREFSYGLWQGKGAAWRRRAHPRLDRTWRTSPWRARFPGGESLAELLARAGAAWDEVVTRRGGRASLIVGHGHLNRMLTLYAFGWPRRPFWEIRQPNGRFTAFERGR